MSHRVSDGAACPWRLYYTRYYSEAAICASRPTGKPIRRTPSALGTQAYEISASGRTASLPGSQCLSSCAADSGGVPRGKGSSARGHIPPVRVRLVRDEIGGEPSDAGSNEAFRAAYRRGSTSPDCEADTLYQRFRRARDDVKALLQLPPSAELT